jgi:hypothetical protein
MICGRTVLSDERRGQLQTLLTYVVRLRRYQCTVVERAIQIRLLSWASTVDLAGLHDRGL